MSNSKNDIAWKGLFDKHNIVEKVLAEGHIYISAKEITKEREARLMTKFDHKSQLPKLFAENKLSILPISRSEYIIGNIDTFQKFDEVEVGYTKIEFPTYLESIDYRDITSEATAINCAFVSKILHDFINDDDLYPTVSGRMSSSSFNFNINSAKGLFKINVVNSQMEIDGGYEGSTSLNLIEAKNYISDDFLIRQLFYPYKLWTSKISKKVRPIFLTYTNGIFHLREYAFTDPNHYNSLQLIRQRKYAIQEGAINLETIEQISNTVKTIKEPELPFPQADSFERVINLCELLKQKGGLTSEEITLNYDFDKRQTSYYTSAGKYLGLIDQKIENGSVIYFLTKKGQQVFNFSIVDRQREFVKLILAHAPFKKALQLYLSTGKVPTKEEIVEIMRKSKLYNVGADTTFFRRASTISSWVDWIMNLIEE